MKLSFTALTVAAAVFQLVAAGAARADDLKVMTSGAFTEAFIEVAPAFERATKTKVSVVFGASTGGAPDSIPARLQRGETFDVAIMSRAALDALVAQGHVAAGSQVDLVRSGIGMAVRTGAPKPDISTVEGLTRALLEAKSIAYSASVSGTYLSTELFPRLGIAEQLRGKTRRIESERVGVVVARGDAEIGFQQVSELLPVAGIDYVGPLPADVQRISVFSAGVAATAANPQAAAALIKFLASPAIAAAAKKNGLEQVAAPQQAQAQAPPPAMPPRSLPDQPFVIDTAEQGQVRVTPMKGIQRPWDMVFLPNGDMLVTEKAGRLRIVSNGKVSPPIAGVPPVMGQGTGGLMGVALHPQFAVNRLVYITYTKAMDGGRHTPVLGRGRLDGTTLAEFKELLVADTPGKGPAAGAPILFGRDGFLYMAVGGANDEIAQRGDSHQGKMLRLRDDGTAAPGNPFIGKPGYKPEIYSLGHRNMIGLTIHPATGEMWENENGPLGGDEVNILEPGANYGWPLVSLGRAYSGARVSEKFQQEGLEDPVLHWTPSIAISGMTFYTGDRFPAWKNNLFVGGLQTGRIPGTGQMYRVHFNDKWEELRREAFFSDLRQRIRGVEQGPDGLLYVLTDEEDGAIMKMEPVAAAVRTN